MHVQESKESKDLKSHHQRTIGATNLKLERPMHVIKLLLLLSFPLFSYCEDIKCLACDGAKEIECNKCKTGEVPCTGKCLKKEMHGWQKMKVAGHSDDELWMKFKQANGTHHAWNQSHIGEVIQIENGIAVNKGKCLTCGGTTRIKCNTCDGDRKISCRSCGGDGTMDENEQNNHKEKLLQEERENTIELKDGTKMKGKVIGKMGNKTIIKKEDGTMIELENDKIK